ncbi:hypothetical protein PR048_020732 [Dryococelus australis]|uniref:Uncharacterized protein n=1 Tax=Dryococelus australis TaxID=614101 RepID=A0ABQ9H764_9NEOP|nr:hypothetical protein PR048_020732 [Dryococelus australis]
MEQGIIFVLRRFCKHQLVSFLLREMSCKNRYFIIEVEHSASHAPDWPSMEFHFINYHQKMLQESRFFSVSLEAVVDGEDWLQVSATLKCREVFFEDVVECGNGLDICPSSEDQVALLTLHLLLRKAPHKSLKMNQPQELNCSSDQCGENIG